MSNNEGPGTKYEEPTSCGSCDLVMWPGGNHREPWRRIMGLKD